MQSGVITCRHRSGVNSLKSVSADSLRKQTVSTLFLARRFFVPQQSFDSRRTYVLRTVAWCHRGVTKVTVLNRCFLRSFVLRNPPFGFIIVRLSEREVFVFWEFLFHTVAHGMRSDAKREKRRFMGTGNKEGEKYVRQMTKRKTCGRHFTRMTLSPSRSERMTCSTSGSSATRSLKALMPRVCGSQS